MGRLVRDAVVLEVARDLPLGDRLVRAVAPHPPAVEVATVGADDDAAEVRVVVDVDREPTPHLRSPPATRSPRLVAVPTRVRTELLAHAARLDPPRPAAALL